MNVITIVLFNYSRDRYDLRKQHWKQIVYCKCTFLLRLSLWIEYKTLMYVTVPFPNTGMLLFIYKVCPSWMCVFRVTSDKFIFVDRPRRDRIDTSRFIARSIDRFRWFRVMYRSGYRRIIVCLPKFVCLQNESTVRFN